jgi:hypothetical protein
LLAVNTNLPFVRKTGIGLCGIHWQALLGHDLFGFLWIGRPAPLIEWPVRKFLLFVHEAMACPYFLPIERLEGSWLHPHRLPLGCGWKGQCTAPGYEGEIPSDEELRGYCNLGYAHGSARLPRDRAWDSVRFGARALGVSGNDSAASRSNGDYPSAGRIQIRYICERDHRPAAQGVLVFDAQSKCEQAHCDLRLQKMAECFLQSYLEKTNRGEAEPAIA